MRAPPSLVSLLEDGLIEAVLRPLQSGKEAQIFLVIAGGEQRVAKVYKAANDRTFKNRVEYSEGRGTRNTRDQRAMKRRSSYGRARDEDSWRSTEVEMIHRLREAEVRVPAPDAFSDGVLIMELVQGADGAPAPRLGDLHVSPEQAVEIHDALIRDVVRMLCAGVVHGDLSEFNVLLTPGGPVIIDLPQAVDASSNPNARKLLMRDVENIQRFVTRWVPGRRRQPFAAEMWALYELNELGPDTELTGTFKGPEGKADTDAVLDMISDAEEDETQRRLGRGQKALSARSGQPRVVVNKAKHPRKNKPRAAAPKKPATPAPPTARASLNDLVAKAMAPAPPKSQPAESRGRKRSERSPRETSGGDAGADSNRRRRRSRTESAAEPRRRESTRSERPARRAGKDGERRARSAETESKPTERSSRADRPDDAPRKRRRRRREEEPTRSSRESSSGSGRSSERPSSREPRKAGPTDGDHSRRERPQSTRGSEDAPRKRRLRSDRGEKESSSRDSSRSDRPSKRSDSPDRRRARPADSENSRPERSERGDRSEEAPRRRRRRSESSVGRSEERSRRTSSTEPREPREPRSSRSGEGSAGETRRTDSSDQAPPKRKRRRRRRPEGEGGAKRPRTPDQ